MASDTVEELTRVKYVGQDFSTYEDEISNYMKDNYPEEFIDYTNNNLGVALFQTIAYPNQNLAFYMNQRATSLFLTESSSPVAISRISRMLNYDIQPAIPFKTEVTVQLKDGPYAFAVKIEKGFRFAAPEGLIYEYRGASPVIYAVGETEKTFEIAEGVSTRNVFVSNGLANQRFNLAGLDTDNFIADQSFEVTVGPEDWEEVRRIPFEATRVFEISYFADPPQMRFGDSVAGLIPGASEEIQVDFFITKGIAGAIGSNQITGAADQLVVRNTNINLEIVSSTESSGGDDPEDLRKVKILAPEFFQSQDRAITKRDYDAISNSFPGVAKADAQIIRKIDDDDTLNDLLDSIVDSVSGCSGTIQADVTEIVSDTRTYLGSTLSDTCRSNTVQVSILSKNGSNRYVAPSETLKEDLRVDLESKNDVVHVVTVVDGSPKIVSVDILVQVKVDFDSVEDDVLERARLSLEKDDAEPFGSLILRDYNDSLFISDLHKAVRDNQAIEGEIVYKNITITNNSDKLDAKGNLILDVTDQNVIQAGTITVEPIEE